MARKKKPTDEELADLAAAGAVVVYHFEDGTTHRVPLVKQIVTESRQKGALIGATRQEAERADAEHRAQSGSHAPRTKKRWGELLADLLREKAPGATKQELWEAIPDDPDDPLVVADSEIVSWNIYRAGDQVYAIDSDADPVLTNPETLKRSSYLKHYL